MKCKAAQGKEPQCKAAKCRNPIFWELVPRNVEFVLMHVGLATDRSTQRRQHLLENLADRQHFAGNAEGPALSPWRTTQPGRHGAAGVTLMLQKLVQHLCHRVLPPAHEWNEGPFDTVAPRMPAANQSRVQPFWLQEGQRRQERAPPNASIEVAFPDRDADVGAEEQLRRHQCRANLGELRPTRWRTCTATVGPCDPVSSLSVVWRRHCPREACGCGRRTPHGVRLRLLALLANDATKQKALPPEPKCLRISTYLAAMPPHHLAAMPPHRLAAMPPPQALNENGK